MKKKLVSLIFALCLVFSLSATVFAERMETTTGGVWFNEDGKTMGNDFTDNKVSETPKINLSNLQPGDSVRYNIEIENRYSKATNWYMTSEIISSLEEALAKGGGYTFFLQYSTTGKKNTIYLSYAIGGGGEEGGKAESRQGLLEINDALKRDYYRNGVRYFYLDNLPSKGKGNIELIVALDGETQGNAYQNKLADLHLDFAVQVADSPSSPKTGDDTNLLPYYIGMIISGLLLLYFVLDAITDRMYQKGRRRA